MDMIVGSFGFGVVFGVAGIWLDQERRDGFASLELSMVVMRGRYSFFDRQQEVFKNEVDLGVRVYQVCGIFLKV